MASLNQVFIIGRLGKDPELRYTQSGSPVCSLNVATDESYTDKEGNRQERVEWHRITAFQRTAENCANFLAKGSLIHISGSLTTRKWQDQQGQDRFTTEIKADRVQFLDRKGDNQGGGQAEQSAPSRQQPAPRGNQQRQQGAPQNVDYTDEVPF